MIDHSLVTHVVQGQRQVHDLLDEIGAPVESGALRERAERSDRFVAAACRHLVASYRVLHDASRDHHCQVDACRHLCKTARTLERDLNAIRTRLYGAAWSNRGSWAELFQRCERHLVDFFEVELGLAREVTQRSSTSEIAPYVIRWQQIHEHGPSRPHPHLPHRGRWGVVSDHFAHRVDTLWDAVQGRAV